MGTEQSSHESSTEQALSKGVLWHEPGAHKPHHRVPAKLKERLWETFGRPKNKKRILSAICEG